MSVTEKVELASPAWLTLARQYLCAHIPALGEVVDGVAFSMCESFTKAPDHLADDAGRAAWWFEIAGGRVTVAAGYRDDVDVLVNVDYAQTLPGARAVYDLDDPAVLQAMAERAAARREALGDRAADAFEALPAEVRTCLTGLHNYLAAQTA